MANNSMATTTTLCIFRKDKTVTVYIDLTNCRNTVPGDMYSDDPYFTVEWLSKSARKEHGSTDPDWGWTDPDVQVLKLDTVLEEEHFIFSPLKEEGLLTTDLEGLIEGYLNDLEWKATSVDVKEFQQVLSESDETRREMHTGLVVAFDNHRIGDDGRCLFFADLAWYTHAFPKQSAKNA